MKYFWLVILASCSYLLVALASESSTVRLYGGNSRLNGLVQLISFAHSNSDARQWNYVCDDGWDINAAKVVCRQLGLGPPIRTDIAQPFPDDGLTHRYVMDNIDCEGTEQYLSDCPHLFDGYNFTLSDCIGSEAVSVACGEPEVRLVSGTFEYTGRVELFTAGEWHSVCGDGFGMSNAEVICKSLGYSGARSIIPTGTFGYGDDSQPIYSPAVQCTGDELYFFDCPSTTRTTECNHNQDVAIYCELKYRLSSDGYTAPSGFDLSVTGAAGIVEVYIQGAWLRPCISSLNEANTVCQYFGMTSALQVSGSPASLIIPPTVFELDCSDDSVNCLPSTQNWFPSFDAPCSNYVNYSVTCQSLRLADGTNRSSGHLEAYSLNGWIPVCFFINFTASMADAACRQLGYPYQLSYQSTNTSSFSGIAITSQSCASSNNGLFDCVTGGIDFCVLTSMLTCDAQLDVRLVGSDLSHVGRLEVYNRLENRWGTVCTSSVGHWENTSNLVCNILGYPGAYSYNYACHPDRFNDPNYNCGIPDVAISSNSPIVLQTFQCGRTDYASITFCDSFTFDQIGSTCLPAREFVIGCNEKIRLTGFTDVANQQGDVNRYGVYGRAELYDSYTKQWGTICDNGWDQHDGDVLCRTLGFVRAINAFGRAELGEGTGRIYMSEVGCTGNETNIFDCDFVQYPTNCHHSEDAGVYCQDIRIVGGPSPIEGRVEIFNRLIANPFGNRPVFPKQWGTICKEFWVVQEAQVVCRTLGYQGAQPSYDTYVPGEGIVWLAFLSCSGSEQYLVDCPHAEGANIQPWECPNHYYDAGAICSDPIQLRLRGSRHENVGRIEIYRDDQWGTVCAGIGRTEATIICQQLGYDDYIDVVDGGVYGFGIGPSYNIHCNGTESSIAECNITNCTGEGSMGVICRDIRLAGNPDDTFNYYAGIPEIFRAGQWRSICGNSFTYENAIVTCEQLQLGLPITVLPLRLPNSDSVVYDTFTCHGNEHRLDNCVINSATCAIDNNVPNFYDSFSFGETDSLDLNVAIDRFPPVFVYLQCADLRLVDGPNSYTGRLEIHETSQWGSICSEGFDSADGDVACRQAGLGNFIRFWTDPTSVHDERRIWLTGVECIGNETSIKYCAKGMWAMTGDCTHTDDVWIQCGAVCPQEIVPPHLAYVRYYTNMSTTGDMAVFECEENYKMINPGFAMCGDDGVWSIVQKIECLPFLRLVDESVDQSVLSIPPYSRGRVEVLVDDSWGTICSTGFDITDAHVICRQLGFPGASSYSTNARYGQGSGRILASNLNCLGSENNIDQCESSAPEGCSHSIDAGVDCIAVRFYESTTPIIPGGSTSNNVPNVTGLVELFYDDVWRIVCMPDFHNSSLARVLCKQLGYGSYITTVFMPENVPDIPAVSINCNGDENSWIDCISNTNIKQQCRVGLNAAGVTCAVKCTYPDLPEHAYVTDLTDSSQYSDQSVTITCDQGYRLSTPNYMIGTFSFGDDTVSFSCGYDENNGNYNWIELSEWSCVEIISLRDSGRDLEGTVYLSTVNGGYYPLCDQQWGSDAAQVVCKELGYPSARRATLQSFFAHELYEALSPITGFSRLDCVGSESSLLDCRNANNVTVEIDSCEGVAGVICEKNFRLSGGSSAYEGRLEYYINGRWGTVCDYGFVQDKLSTICSTLDLGPGVAIIKGSLYGDTDLPIVAHGGSVACSGDECVYNYATVLGACTHVNDTGIICSSPVKFYDDGARNPWEGLIQVYTRNEYHFICNRQWTMIEANVVCKQLGYPSAVSIEYTGPNSNYSSAEIDFSCDGTEDNLLDCQLLMYNDGSAARRACANNYASVICKGQCRKEDVVSNTASITISPDKTIYDPGETVNIECNAGYTRNSDESIVWRCLDGAIWSGNVFNCTPIGQCTKEDLVNDIDPASITITPDKNIYDPGETVNIECNAGYTRISDENIVWRCLDGAVWSGNVFNCAPITAVSESSEDDEIGVGGIAGISVGAALLAVSAVIGILGLIWYMRRRRKSSEKADMEMLTKTGEGVRNEVFSDVASEY